MPQKITIKEALQKQEAIFIDTRAPIEFAEDHLPNAVNVPILNNEERAIVGTIYKQVSQEKAIDIGMEFYKNKIPTIMKAVEPYKNKTLIIHCWRGGLRSKTIAALLENAQFNVFQLEGGYKAYRMWIKEMLDHFQLKQKLIILYGRTCTGKTALLKQLPTSIDLEALAGHRGSMYGGIGLQQNSQKKFENLLLQRLMQLENNEHLIVEGESKRIGNVFLPKFFSDAMEQGIKIEVVRSMEKRASAAAEEYCSSESNVEEMQRITKRIHKGMSNKTKEEILINLDKKDYEKAWKLLFTEYYDPMYDHLLKKLEYATRIKNDSVEEGTKELKEFLATNF